MKKNRRPNPPSIIKIIKYWMNNNIFEDDPHSWFNPAIDVGEPACFGCHCYTSYWDLHQNDKRRDKWEKCWQGASNYLQLERAHIIPYSLGGSNEPSNFVMLCRVCHADAPNVNNRKYFLTWVRRRKGFLIDMVADNLKLASEQFPDVKREMDISKKTKGEKGLDIFDIYIVPEYKDRLDKYMYEESSFHASFGNRIGQDRVASCSYTMYAFLQELIDNKELEIIKQKAIKVLEHRRSLPRRSRNG